MLFKVGLNDMKAQYYTTYTTGGRNYPSVPSDVVSDAESRIGVLDTATLYTTGQNEYQLAIDRPIGDDKLYTYQYSDGRYFVTLTGNDEYSVNWSNPMKVYSTESRCLPLQCNHLDYINTWCFLGITTLVFLGVMFKGVLFRCLKK